MARTPKPKNSSSGSRKNPNPPLSKAAQDRRKKIDNARRRYQRQKDRYADLAAKSRGKEKKIYEQAANEMQSRADQLKGVNVRKKLDSNVNELIKDSKNYLASNNKTEWQRGETMGKLRLSGTNLGHRFYALTESLWEGIGYSGKIGDDRRLNAIRRALGKNPEVRKKYGRRPNASQMIEIIEDLTGVDMDTDSSYNVGDSKEVNMMRGADLVLQNYG